MRTQLVGLTILTSLALIPAGAGSAAAQCCHEHKGAQHAANCCNTGDCCVMADPEITAVTVPAFFPPGVVQKADIVFRDPVQVRDRILMGRYVIEHDEGRMARGEPCTHIYHADRPGDLVVAFHCTHLERPVTWQNTVVLAPGPLSIKTLSEFQFAGDTASHGVPAIR